ncbi:MAG: AmmeMemoRadiSam system protein A [Candidatus Nealsonbacteria bacterium]|nr:MAG: AmmeMemoRadiSam system protein A [Candidatus Nealsonbacteria bacterium]
MHPCLQLAKKAVENYIKKREVIELPEGLPKELTNKKAGVFVTIEKNGKLRGCIGTYLPTKENIAKEIIYNAIAAATEDWRFGPIQREELNLLSYTVYILDLPQQIKNISELNPKKYGILVRTFTLPPKSALLLPDLEGIDTVEKQISIACQKGGIDPLREKIIIYKFTAKRISEKNDSP